MRAVTCSTVGGAAPGRMQAAAPAATAMRRRWLPSASGSRISENSSALTLASPAPMVSATVMTGAVIGAALPCA